MPEANRNRLALIAHLYVSLLAVAYGDTDHSGNECNGCSIAVVGGGVAGTVTALELLTRPTAQVRHVTLYEQAATIGHTKSASGIIAAILGFASSHKYWDKDIPAMKLRAWFAMRPEMITNRLFNFAETVANNHILNDERVDHEYQQQFFHASRQHLEDLVDIFPELCGAVIGPFCCRMGNDEKWQKRQKWMTDPANLKKYNLDCSRLTGAAHVFTTDHDALLMNDTKLASKDNFNILLRGPRTQEWNDDDEITPTLERVMRILGTELEGALWNSHDEGFVRVEHFFPIAMDIFKKSKRVTVITNCNVRSVQPSLSSKKIDIEVPFNCPNGSEAFDKVIVAAGVNTVNLLKFHDRGIRQELVPVKGFAVASNKALVEPENLQIGIEHEEYGHYIRAQSNGGVRYGYGRELGTFDDQLLDPTFEGWQPGTGPNRTHLGRQIIADKDHANLAGFRPLSSFLRFPILKTYDGRWENLLVNTGFGFHGYGMAWKSAELIVDIALYGRVREDQWAKSYDRKEGDVVCEPTTLGISNLFIIVLGLGGIVFAMKILALVFQSKVPSTGEQELDTLLMDEFMDPKDLSAIAKDISWTRAPEPAHAKYRRLIQSYNAGVLSRAEFENAKRTIQEYTTSHYAQVNEVEHAPGKELNENEWEIEELVKALDILIFQSKVYTVVFLVVAVMQFLLAMTNNYPLIVVLLTLKVGVMGLVQRRMVSHHHEDGSAPGWLTAGMILWICSVCFLMLGFIVAFGGNVYVVALIVGVLVGVILVFGSLLAKVGPYGDEFKALSLRAKLTSGAFLNDCKWPKHLAFHNAVLNEMEETHMWLWYLVKSTMESSDQDLDGANAGQSLRLRQDDTNKLLFGRFQQSFVCSPVIGRQVAFLGPFITPSVLFLSITVLQFLASFKYLHAASKALHKDRREDYQVALYGGADGKNIVAETNGKNVLMGACKTLRRWNEVWRDIGHGTDVCGLMLANRVAVKLCNTTAEQYHWHFLKDPPSSALHEDCESHLGKYGRISTFILKTTLEAALGLVINITITAVLLDTMLPKELMLAVLSLLSSGYTVIEGIHFQLTNAFHIEANMVRRWYGYSGFYLQRTNVFCTGFLLIVALVRMGGFAICHSRVLDMVTGCIEWEVSFALTDPWPTPTQRVGYGIMAVLFTYSAVHFAVLMKLAQKKTKQAEPALNAHTYSPISFTHQERCAPPNLLCAKSSVNEPNRVVKSSC